MESKISWLWVLIILPVLAAFCREWISDTIKDRLLYARRRFDDDNDPATGQFFDVCSATDDGKWAQAYLEEYEFSYFRPSRRLVHFWVRDHAGIWRRISKTYADFRKMTPSNKSSTADPSIEEPEDRYRE